RRGRSSSSWSLPRAISALWVLMILPLASTRKHSVMPLLPPRSTSSPGSSAVILQERRRLASGDGGVSAVLGVTLLHTACITGAKTAPATPPPVEPPPSVRRLPLALSYPIQTAIVTSLVKPTNQASFSSSEVPVLPAT